MINKRSLWFLTLFSLILVLSVYYITMPSELLIATNNGSKETQTVSKEETTKENAELVALRVEEEEKTLDKITELKKILTDSKATTEEKNKAFEELQNINKNKSEEEKIEEIVEKEHKLKSFVTINDKKINIVVDSKDEGTALANKIMRTVQNNYNEQMTISVKFRS
ncbi:MAG: SpoIIIAH-like family protein [Bacilli bacterium]|nr:SpoIIIAH-like family protein [Bacilli bacterium]